MGTSAQELFLGDSGWGEENSPALAMSDMFGGGHLRAQKMHTADLAWQEKMIEQDREFQKQFWHEQQESLFNIWQQQRDREFQDWRNQFDITNAYNDPSAQVERLMRGGINPALIFSGAGAGSASGHSGAQPSMSPSPFGTATIPGSRAPSAPGFMNTSPSNIAMTLNSIGNFAEKISLAKKNGMEMSRYDEYMNSLLDKMRADKEFQDSASSLNRINQEILDKSKDVKIAQESAKFYQMVADAFDSAAEGLLKEQEVKTELHKTKYWDYTQKIAKNDFDNWEKNFMAKLSNLNSQTLANRAQAVKDTTQADVNREQKEYVRQSTDVQRHEATIKKLQANWTEYEQKAFKGELTPEEETDYSMALHDELIGRLESNTFKSQKEIKEAQETIRALENADDFNRGIYRAISLLRSASKGK